MSETVSSCNDDAGVYIDVYSLLEINLSSKYLLYIKMHAYTQHINESHIKHKALYENISHLCVLVSVFVCVNPLPCSNADVVK